MHNHKMSDVSDPLLTCDADVVGSNAALNNNSMHVDTDVDVTGENTHSPRSSSPQSPASALSSFLSMIEYVTTPVLIDIAKRHNVQLPLQINLEMLRALVISHLSSGERKAPSSAFSTFGSPSRKPRPM